MSFDRSAYMKEYNRKYYQANRKKLDERNAERLRNSSEQRRRNVERATAWNQANRERHRQIARKSDRKRYVPRPKPSEAEMARRKEVRRQLTNERIKAWKLTHLSNSFVNKENRLRARDLRLKWRYWGGLCWMCRKPATTWDHVKPLSKGGSFSLANLRPACKSCNSQKGAKWPWPLVDYAQNEKAKERMAQGFRDRRPL